MPGVRARAVAARHPGSDALHDMDEATCSGSEQHAGLEPDEAEGSDHAEGEELRSDSDEPLRRRLFPFEGGPRAPGRRRPKRPSLRVAASLQARQLAAINARCPWPTAAPGRQGEHTWSHVPGGPRRQRGRGRTRRRPAAAAGRQPTLGAQAQSTYAAAAPCAGCPLAPAPLPARSLLRVRLRPPRGARLALGAAQAHAGQAHGRSHPLAALPAAQRPRALPAPHPRRRGGRACRRGPGRGPGPGRGGASQRARGHQVRVAPGAREPPGKSPLRARAPFALSRLCTLPHCAGASGPWLRGCRCGGRGGGGRSGCKAVRPRRRGAAGAPTRRLCGWGPGCGVHDVRPPAERPSSPLLDRCRGCWLRRRTWGRHLRPWRRGCRAS